MNVGIFLGHPAQFHYFKNTARQLKAAGHQVFFAVKQKDILELLLQDEGVEYTKVRGSRGNSRLDQALSVIKMDYNMVKFVHRNKLDIMIGVPPTFGTRIFSRTKVVVCGEDDADVVPLSAWLIMPYTHASVSPTTCDNGRWEHKSAHFPGYLELAYLHPNNFTPKAEVLKSYGIDSKKPYFIMRFSSLNAHHDSGIKGINTEIAQRLIDILKPHGRIYITSERPLEPQFEQYRIKINPLDMHHVMAFASLYIGDSQTMAAEAGVLGVPFVRFNDFVGRIGYLRELEDKYRLGFGVHASPILMENKNIKNRDKNNENSLEDNQKKVIENAESLVTDSNSTSIDQHSACEQAPRQTIAQSCLTDTDAQSLSNDSAQKIASLPKNDKNVIYRLDGTVQPSGVEALIETVERLVGMEAEERRRVFAERRKQMLADKIDCAQFLTWFIEQYPKSVAETKVATPDFWTRFK